MGIEGNIEFNQTTSEDDVYEDDSSYYSKERPFV